MNSLYLKCLFEDGTVYFKLDAIKNPSDNYIYEGVEVIHEADNHWETDVYELTEEDLNEMYDDGFCDIEKEEFEEAYSNAKKHVKK